jgi:hypothetical protein
MGGATADLRNAAVYGPRNDSTHRKPNRNASHINHSNEYGISAGTGRTTPKPRSRLSTSNPARSSFQ